jgi:hypothetical protein
MVCALQARKFLHEWHSAIGAAMLCIWWDMKGDYPLRTAWKEPDRHC